MTRSSIKYYNIHPSFWASVLFFLIMGFSGCADQVKQQERLVSIPKQTWMQQFQPWVHLNIGDSTLLYNIYAVVRHNQEFKYDNLLLRYGYIAPGDSAIYHEVNLPLAKNGRWLGDTLGTVIETRIRLGSGPRRLPTGDNVFVMAHLMPDDPLAGILQIGVRIEAATGANTMVESNLTDMGAKHSGVTVLDAKQQPE